MKADAEETAKDAEAVIATVRARDIATTKAAMDTDTATITEKAKDTAIITKMAMDAVAKITNHKH